MITRKIIGVDMGSCEVAASYPYVDSEDRVVSMINLFLDGDKNTVIPSAVMFTGTDHEEVQNIVIGVNAIETKSNEESFNYFKESPKYFEERLGNSQISRRELMAAFFRKLLYNIKKYNEVIDEEDRILMVVGCPSSVEWTSKENREKYETLIEEATGVQEVRIVPESRAAMFSVLGSRRNYKVSASQGAAVFDFGSLTADFTYMKSGVGQKEFSWRLGASRIEQGLRKMMCQEALPKAAEFGGKIDTDSLAKLDNLLRKKKENFFDDKLDDGSAGFSYQFKVVDGQGIPLKNEKGKNRTIPCMILMDEDLMDQVLEESIIGLDIASDDGKKMQIIQGSFKELCRNFFERAKDSLVRHHLPLDTIVLTGGASRMGFVRELAREVFFELDEENIILSDTPSFSVSNGLVWVAISDEKQAECVEKAAEEVLAEPECSLQSLKEALSVSTQKFIYDGVMGKARDWAQSERNLSINDLTKSITDWMESEEMKESMQREQNMVIEQWKNKTKKMMEEAVNRQAAEILSSQIKEGLMIPADVWSQLQVNNLKINLQIEKVIDKLDLDGLGRRIAEYVILTVAIGVGGCFGLPGLAVGWITGIIAAACISDSDKQKLRDKKTRMRALKEFSKKERGNDIKSGVKEGLASSFDSMMTNEDYQASIKHATEVAFEIVTLRRFEV